jgi:phosphoribosyl-ATP pyrophosphohydrolase / phosphoribosyl-AMP cyclohydrolase / histidinol dehydrogenase
MLIFHLWPHITSCRLVDTAQCLVAAVCGCSQMTSVPYATFTNLSALPQGASLSAVGRCRIPLTVSQSPTPSSDDSSPATTAYATILDLCKQQAAALHSEDDKEANKKLAKKFMKQGVALAADLLQTTLGLDVSVVDVEVHLLDLNDVIQTDGCIASCFLDAGCARIVLTHAANLEDAIHAARVPRERLMVHYHPLDGTGVSSSGPFLLLSLQLVDQVKELIKQVQEDCDMISVCADIQNIHDTDALANLLSLTSERDVGIVVQIQSGAVLNDNGSDEASNNNTLSNLVGNVLQSTPSDSSRNTISLLDPTAQQLGQCYSACLKTDRLDGLYTTVVCTRTGEALGLVYSSVDSIVAALECGRGVYYSRSRQSLWRKGDTSGHYQTLHRIDVDCDGDALRFTVTQQNTSAAAGAFCHLDTLTCWGAPRGLRHLEQTLQERLKAAPEGSYTKRLFDDETLLREKLVEEAQELAEADTATHVAEELADVLYFSMVRAAKFGVSIDDAAAELDRRTRKVTRRAGDSKAFRTQAAQDILEQANKSDK